MTKVSVRLDNEKTEDVLGLVGSPSIVLSELIKNSIDSNSHSVDIYIDTRRMEVIVSDKGDGLSEEDIKNLGLIGESDKKETGKECRENGEYYSGSKGLGLLSAFSLSDYIEIRTRKNNKSYLIKWPKAKGEFSYEDIDQLNNCGTELIIKNISKDDINILTDEEEYKKLRHVTICHFKNKGNTCERINFYINGKLKDEFSCCDIKDIDDIFIYKINFRYFSKTNKLQYKFDRADVNRMIKGNKINKGNKPIDRLSKVNSIDLNNNININDIIKNTYKVTKTTSEKKLKYLSSSLEDFYGSLYVTAGQHSSEIKKSIEQFGYGVKVFVNNFAIYGYLDNENDWLGFSELSQLGKFTTLKPHNVFGYVSFDEFNEKKSSLEIANERTNFIEKAPYKKFIEIMKNIIIKIAFEVDVAYRNKNIDSKDYFKDLKNGEDSNTDNTDENGLKSDNNTDDIGERGNIGSDLGDENELKSHNSDIDDNEEGNKGSQLDDINESKSDNNNTADTKKYKSNGDKDSDLDDEDENESKLDNSNTDVTGNSRIKTSNKNIRKEINKNEINDESTKSKKKQNVIPAVIKLKNKNIEIAIPSSQINLYDYIKSANDSKGKKIDNSLINIEVDNNIIENNILQSVNVPCLKIIKYFYNDHNTGLVIKELKIKFYQPHSKIDSKMNEHKLISLPTKKNYTINFNFSLNKLINQINELKLSEYNEVIACSLRSVFEISIDSLIKCEKFHGIFQEINKLEERVGKVVEYINNSNKYKSEISKDTAIDFNSLKNILKPSDFKEAIEKANLGAHKSTTYMSEVDVKNLAKIAALFITIVNEMINNEQIV